MKNVIGTFLSLGLLPLKEVLQNPFCGQLPVRKDDSLASNREFSLRTCFCLSPMVGSDGPS